MLKMNASIALLLGTDNNTTNTLQTSRSQFKKEYDPLDLGNNQPNENNHL